LKRRPVFKLLPPIPEADGPARRLYVAGMPLADSVSDTVPYRLERVLFAIVDAEGRAARTSVNQERQCRA
jgi:hypothetical protein